MAQLWRETAGGQRLRVMAKYQMLLALAGREPFDPALSHIRTAAK
jgi:hypothetical protein